MVNNPLVLNNATIIAMQLLSEVIIPIIVATVIVLPIIAALSKGILWGAKEEE